MRIVFIGAVRFSRHALAETIAAGGDVVAVLTLAAEDATASSDYTDLAPLAESHGIPVHRVKGTNSAETIALVRSLRPEVIFVFGWSRLLAAEMLSIPELGCLGVHPALLPKHRGRHPLIWALVEGMEESGLTFFFLDEGADSGDIIWQKPFPIDIEDDAGVLYAKIEALATEAIHEFVPQLADGTAKRVSQDHSKATYWRKRGQEDGVIDWSAPAMTTYNLIRALARPYAGANTYFRGEKVTVWRATPPQAGNKTLEDRVPGMIVALDDQGLTVATEDGDLTLVEIEYDGPGRLRAGALLGGED